MQHYLLDADSGIELRTSAEVELGSGQKQTLTTAMSNYKQVDGIMIPHTVTQTAGGRTLLQWTITTRRVQRGAGRLDLPPAEEVAEPPANREYTQKAPVYPAPFSLTIYVKARR